MGEPLRIWSCTQCEATVKMAEKPSRRLNDCLYNTEGEVEEVSPYVWACKGSDHDWPYHNWVETREPVEGFDPIELGC